MNKNKITIFIVIFVTVIVLAGAWFYLQYIMDEYDIDRKDWDDTTYSSHVNTSLSRLYSQEVKFH